MNALSQYLPPPGVGIPSRSKAWYTAFCDRPSTPLIWKMRRTIRIFSSSTRSPSRVALSLKPYFIQRTCQHLAFAGLAELSSAAPLGYLCPLVLRQLVEDAIREFPLWALVASVVEGPDLR